MLLENTLFVVGCNVFVNFVAPMSVFRFQPAKLSLLLHLSLHLIVSLPNLLAYPFVFFVYFIAEVQQVVLLLLKCLSCDILTSSVTLTQLIDSLATHFLDGL